MRIDWLTVVAQIVNFLVLVWLLKRFLYQPVIDAMARREERIAARLQQAAQREDEAEARTRDYSDKIEAFERARAQQFNDAREAAVRERRRLLDEARREIEQQREKWRAELRREQDDFREALRRDFAEAAMVIARRALADLADTALERQIVAAFLRRLRSLSDAEREPFTRATPALRISSTFRLDEDTRKQFSEALGTTAAIQYASDPAHVCGIAVAGAGHKLEWNFDHYLADAQDRVRDRLAASAADAKERV